VVVPLVVALVFVPVPAPAADHVLSGADVSVRLGQAAAARRADLAELGALLGSPAGRQAARLLGTDPAHLQARLVHLGDAEARDLARRARALRADPTASALSSKQVTWIIIGGVLVVALALWLTFGRCDPDNPYDACYQPPPNPLTADRPFPRLPSRAGSQVPEEPRASFRSGLALVPSDPVGQMEGGTMLRRLSQLVVAPLVAALVFIPVPVPAADHVVSGADVSARLQAAAAARQADLAALEAFLASPLGQQAARVVGTDPSRLQARFTHLSDAEARDLAGRVRALSADPTATGLSGGAIAGIIIGGVALLILMTWLIYEAYDDDFDDDYYYYY
jgi:hypothetical protein